MAVKPNMPGGQASAILFSELENFGDQVPVLKGNVKYREAQIVNEQEDDVHSFEPYLKSRHVSGHIKMTFKIPANSGWIRGDIIYQAELEVTFTNGRTISFSGVTLTGDPVEKDLVEGSTNELTFSFVSSTEK